MSSGLEDAVKRLKEEGYTSEDIQKALHLMMNDRRTEKTFSSLDEYLDTLED